MKSIRHAYPNLGKSDKKQYYRRLFTFEEDSKLILLVEKFKDNWKKIANEMNDRSVRQCKERYYHYLSPDIKRKEWSHDEDILLLSSVKKYGKKWKSFECIFEGRTEIDIRNRFNVLSRQIAKKVKKEDLTQIIEKKSQKSDDYLFQSQIQNENSNCEYEKQDSREIKGRQDQVKLKKKDNELHYFADENLTSDLSDDSFYDFITDFCL